MLKWWQTYIMISQAYRTEFNMFPHMDTMLYKMSNDVSNLLLLQLETIKVQ